VYREGRFGLQDEGSVPDEKRRGARVEESEKVFAQRVYPRLCIGIDSVNRFNQINIRVDKRMTPNERNAVVPFLENEFLSAIRPDSWLKTGVRYFSHRQAWQERKRSLQLDAQVRTFISRWKSMDNMPGGATDWRRTFINRGMAHYQFSPSAQSDMLLIGFTGKAGRLMMATPDFLQSIGALRADVLILWARRGADYSAGIPGLGSDLRSAFERLTEFVEQRGYKSLGVLGTSGGGTAAIIFALDVLPARFVLVGSSDPRRSTSSPAWEQALERQQNVESFPTGLILVGEDAPTRDIEAAQYLRSSVHAPIQFLPGGHSPLHLLAEKGSLGLLLRDFYRG